MKKMLLLLSLFLLCGCEKGEIVTMEEAQREQFVSLSEAKLALEPLIAVEGDLRLEKVTKGKFYSFLYETDDGELEWIDIYNEEDYDLKVKKSNKGYSYLVRELNEVRESPFTESSYYASSTPKYTLYLHTEDLTDTSYEESCGKSCTRDVHVNVIN